MNHMIVFNQLVPLGQENRLDHAQPRPKILGPCDDWDRVISLVHGMMESQSASA